MEHYFILGLILGALALFALEVVRPDVIALGVTLLLLLTGTVTTAEGFSGFSNPAVITVIAMFILSSGLVRTGVADKAAGLLGRVGGGRPALLTLAVMGLVGLLSAFMNNIGAVAVLIPAMFLTAQRSGYPVSRLLIPLSFGSLLGGLTTLVGTPPNLLVSTALEQAGWPGFRMFDFLPTGLAVVTTGALYMAFAGRHLIPERKAADDLTQEFALQGYLTELVIPPGSDLAGKTIEHSQVGSRLGLTILRIQRESDEGRVTLSPGPETVLYEGDRLVVEGDVGGLFDGRRNRSLEIYAARKLTAGALTDDQIGLAEAAVAPGSRLVGTTIDQGVLRRRYDVLVMALRRRGHTLQGRFVSMPLAVGDLLLVQGRREALADMARGPDFLTVNIVEPKRRYPHKAVFALASFGLAVGTAATGLLHISVAGMLGVLAMVVTGCIRPDEMYRAVEWRVIFLIAFMMPLSVAMDDGHTDTARWLADGIVGLVGDAGPLVMLGALFLFTTLITEVMSNAAAAVLLAPIGVAVAAGLGLEPYPFLMGIAMGASTTFLTPIGHQANVLVYGIGNFRFLDFPRVGALLNILIFGVTLAVVPLVWPFTPVAG